MATARVEAIRNRSRSQVLFLDRFGKKQLATEKESWARLTGAVQMVFDEGTW